MPKLLVRATNWLGDAVMCLPAMREIRRAHPGWHITVLARPWVADLYAREDFADAIVLYEMKSVHSGLLGKRRLARELRRERYDRAILLQNAFDAALVAALARIPERIGYARDARRPLLTQPIDVPRDGDTPAHERFYYLELLRRAGLINELPECSDIRLSGAMDAAAAGREEWARRGYSPSRWIGVSPGAAFGTAKQWLPERFAEAARQLASECDARVAVFGSPAEARLGRQVAEAAGPEAISLAGETTLREFIDLAATCSLFLTNDSGPMHVACALSVPTVAVFGSTDHIATGPSASWARIVREPVDCAPCKLRECPIDHPCMTGVTASRVVVEAHGLLSETAAAAN